MRFWGACLAMAVTAASLASPAAAGAAALVPLAPGSSWGGTPVDATSPPGDPRLFVVERSGAVRIVADGALLPEPFLTVPNVATGGERGLLSIAFPPDYASSGLFYVFTVASAPDGFGGEEGDLRVLEYRRSAADPNRADPASARLVLAQKHPGATNHNGGQLTFGPEGLLYVTMGDGATGSNSQSLATDLGKVLRIDPRLQPGGAPFGVPPSNPFVSGFPGAKPEIYALGLRNPFRASFAPDGNLVLPDVGNSAWEEVNLGRATGAAAATTLAGANLGWPTCEGACVPANPSFVDPIFQYAHDSSLPCSAIIGGHVVRDRALAGLAGRYLYGDLCSPDLRTLDLDAPGADPRPAGLSIPSAGGSLLAFGEGAGGCSYVLTDVTAYRVASTPDADAACPPFTEAGPSGGGAGSGGAGKSGGGLRAPGPSLMISHHVRQLLGRPVRLTAGCDVACTVTARGSLTIRAAAGSAGQTAAMAATGSAHRGAATAAAVASSGVLRPNRHAIAAGKRVRLVLRLRHGAVLRALPPVRRGGIAELRVLLTATAAAGASVSQPLRFRLLLPPGARR